MNGNDKIILVLRWIARIWGIASVAFIVAIVVGETLSEPGPFRPEAWELVALAFFPLGVGVGILTGYWKELTGGIITIASLLLFYIAEFIPSGDLARGPWFLLTAAPGIIVFAVALLSRHPVHRRLAREQANT